MKKFIVLIFILVSVISFSQDWSFQYLPYYRQIHEIHLLSMHDISALGGWPYNDSITDMYFSDNGGETWQFQDIFPGKMIKSGLYYNNGNAICGGLNEVCYTTEDFGRNWVENYFDVDLNHRNVNKFAKGQWGNAYACGGVDQTDGFVMKTDNYGENWTIIKEFPDYELNSIYAINNEKIICCGPENFLIKTSNSGENWTSCDIIDFDETCEFNALKFFGSEHGYCVGGRQGVDSLQVVLKTIDGGATWFPCLNLVNPMLNDIEIINDSVAYVVGNYGVILKTSDYGESWQDVIITDNPSYHLYAIDFLNRHFGVIAGNYGIVFHYNDGLLVEPEANTYIATDVTSHSAKINGSFNTGFLYSEVSFKYGLDANVENEVLKGTFNSGSLENISHKIDGLEPNTHYYYCIEIENDYGVYRGDIKVFYTGNPIPNWDFEFWTEKVFEFPTNWFAIGNCEKIDLGGEYAISMGPADYNDNDAHLSALVNAMIDGDGEDDEIPSMWDIPAEYIYGGVQTTSRPDSIYASVKYNIAEQDSALIFIAFLSDNEYVSYDILSFKGEQSDFVQVGHEIQYLNSNTPDRYVILMVNTNPLIESSGTSNSFTVSELRFSNLIEIPNRKFSSWETDTIEFPDSWEYRLEVVEENGNPDYYLTVHKVEDAYFNDYAISIKNVINDSDSLHAKIEIEDPKIPVDKRYYNFYGYYKYFPEGNDTASIALDFFKEGENIGSAQFRQWETTNVWTNFNVPIVFCDEIVVPDSLTIRIEASQSQMIGESELFVDKLCLDGDFIPVKPVITDGFLIYPNPVRDKLYFSEPVENVCIFNSLGQKVLCKKETCNELNVSMLKTGVYLFWTSNNKLIKFVKK